MEAKVNIDDIRDTVIEGDCLQVMRGLPDGCVDAVVTDPPYGVDFADWDKRCVQALFGEWLHTMLRLAGRATFTCGWSRLSDWCVIRKPSAYLYWYKPGCMGFGPFGFTNIDPMPVYGHVKMVGKTDVIVAPIIVGEHKHPTEKPIAWAVGAIERMTCPGNTILDPFFGSGTTGVAAIRTGRHFIGIEISPEYCEIARQRIEAERKGLTVKELKRGQMTLLEGLA